MHMPCYDFVWAANFSDPLLLDVVRNISTNNPGRPIDFKTQVRLNTAPVLVHPGWAAVQRLVPRTWYAQGNVCVHRYVWRYGCRYERMGLWQGHTLSATGTGVTSSARLGKFQATGPQRRMEQPRTPGERGNDQACVEPGQERRTPSVESVGRTGSSWQLQAATDTTRQQQRVRNSTREQQGLPGSTREQRRQQAETERSRRQQGATNRSREERPLVGSPSTQYITYSTILLHSSICLCSLSADPGV